MVADSRDYLVRETLKGGEKVTVRAIRPDDAARILDAFGRLDRDSIYRRFFSPKKALSDAELKQLTEVDFKQVTALVVTKQAGDVETLLGGGRYAAEAEHKPQSAELAFLTASEYRGRGIASLLLRHLALLAQASGLSRFVADVLADNEPMLNVFRRSGLAMTQSREGNVIHVTLTLGAPATDRP